MEHEKRVADYFIVSGVSEQGNLNVESKQLITNVLPITDIAVIFKSLDETCPEGFTCIETTPSGQPADLNHGALKSMNIQVCYRQGTDKPPLLSVGVYHEGKERVLPDVEVIWETPYGNSANTSQLSKTATYLTYKRAKVLRPFNHMVVVDLCVILNNKSEYPPHAFYPIRKNLNKGILGMIGSEVFLCYKKTLLSPPAICYTPQIISRFPLKDYPNFPLPETVPLFCLPTGANVELWSDGSLLHRPTSSTFVLTSDSAQKIYGTALAFYEYFDESKLTADQKRRLGFDEENLNCRTYAIKSICILSRWPFFKCFEKFLSFLHRLVFGPKQFLRELTPRNQTPIEHHISHFLLDVSFPTQQRPTVMVQLMPGTDETLTISQPSSRLPLPLTGASFIQLLSTLGVDNCISVLLYGLTEQKILLHSLRPWVLTGVAEAISAMLFPFQWQCPYVPLCPLSLHGILNAPLPFIVGIDSRCFDTFTPPEDLVCIDLDTMSIFLSELKKCLNVRILPKRAVRTLKASLEKIFQKLVSNQMQNQSPLYRPIDPVVTNMQFEKKIELEIQEAFIRFMATILKGFRSHLLPITRAPTVSTTDPTSLFDFEGFLQSRDQKYIQFYKLMTRTQMFTHYIEERSFVSDKNTSLAFFDDCEEKISFSDSLFSGKPVKLFDKDDSLIQTDRSVYIPAPEQSMQYIQQSTVPSDLVDLSPTTSDRITKFGPLNPSLFHRHPQLGSLQASNSNSEDATSIDNNIIFSCIGPTEPNNSFSVSRRTKQEVKASQKLARKSSTTALGWSKYLLSCCYCLWFSVLPSYVTYTKSTSLSSEENLLDTDSKVNKSVAKLLRYAFTIILRMQKLKLNTDEICFRISTLLCGYYGQPALAVRFFFEMEKAGLKPNAVTYGYYNKAVFESKWPDLTSRSTEALWSKIRNVIIGVALFKMNGKMLKDRRNHNLKSSTLATKLGAHDTVDRAIQSNGRLDNDIVGPLTGTLIDCDESASQLVDFNDHLKKPSLHKSQSTYSRISDEHDDSETSEEEQEVKSQNHPNQIHKSHSIHISPHDNSSVNLLIDTRSIHNEVDEPLYVSRYNAPVEGRAISSSKYASQFDFYLKLRGKYQLLSDVESARLLPESLDFIESSAGLLFSTSRASPKLLFKDQTHDIGSNQNKVMRSNSLFRSCHPLPIVEDQSFGQDEKILENLKDSAVQHPNGTAQDVNSLNAELCEEELGITSILNACGDTTIDDRDDVSRSSDNVTSTPNFKLSALINDASNLQWSKWTSSNNSKNMYKGIKSAATGLVTSLQEIKSSFSIPNAQTPAKLFASSAYPKSTTTRDMISQWANYFTPQAPKTSDFDDSGSESDLLRLSDNEDTNPFTSENSNEIKMYNSFFEELEKHYTSATSRQDLKASSSTVSGHLDTSEKSFAMKIEMTTCSRCNVCRSLLYDEEIMEKWSHNESNLNTKCIYCRAKIVPLMSISIEDMRFNSSVRSRSEMKPLTSTTTSGSVEETFDLVDLDFGEDQQSDIASTTKSSELNNQKEKPRKGEESSFTVPYLSPIVLRKELENVFESSGDNCPTSSKFVDEHPIIYWNLLWYFTRINVPTHLTSLCLNAKSLLNGRDVPSNWLNNDKVIIKTLWDNEKLHSEIGKPLYRLWQRGNPSTNVDAILSDKLYFAQNPLNQVMEFIKINEPLKAMNLILNARLKSSTKFLFDKNRHNLYRDLIFLTITAHGSKKFYYDNFEREYKKAFESLNFQQVALNRFDRPPTIGSLFCRKCFKELSLN